MANNAPFKLLFVCRHNSIRSQVAEVLANQISHGKVAAQSAGIDLSPVPEFIHKWVAQMTEQSEQLSSTPVTDVKATDFDMIITLCDKSHQALPSLEADSQHICWDFQHPDDESSLKHLEIELAERLRLMFLAKGILQ